MATQAELRKQRIPFGGNGIKDGTGRVIRTDHPSWGDMLRDAVPDVIKAPNKKTDREMERISQMKKKQDKLSGMTRRNA